MHVWSDTWGYTIRPGYTRRLTATRPMECTLTTCRHRWPPVSRKPRGFTEGTKHSFQSIEAHSDNISTGKNHPGMFCKSLKYCATSNPLYRCDVSPAHIVIVQNRRALIYPRRYVIKRLGEAWRMSLSMRSNIASSTVASNFRANNAGEFASSSKWSSRKVSGWLLWGGHLIKCSFWFNKSFLKGEFARIVWKNISSGAKTNLKNLTKSGLSNMNRRI